MWGTQTVTLKYASKILGQASKQEPSSRLSGPKDRWGFTRFLCGFWRNVAKRNAAERQLGQCGKLLKARRGEVAERLNAAVC